MADLGWTVDRIAREVGGRVLGDGGASTVSRVSIDSREDVSGALFVALRGERFDGHDFARDCARRGAAAIVTEAPLDGIRAPLVLVEDTLLALQALGRARRAEFRGTVVAITGSSGKTTTRKILASILSQGAAVHQPERNFNNHVGVPLTLLGLEDRHGAAVVEIGCSGFGEIAPLARIASPDAGLVTNVGPAHLEALGDLDGVARAKGELLAELSPGATAVINLDDPRVAAMETPARLRVTYGAARGADVRLVDRRPAGLVGQEISIDALGAEVRASLPLPGAHNAANALAAAAAAAAVGSGPEAIAIGLERTEQTPGRLEIGRGAEGSLLIDDTYNANPASTRAALDLLEEADEGARRIAVLGDMLELGDGSAAAHRGIGEAAARAGLDLLVTLGEGGGRIGEAAVEAGLSPRSWVHAADHRGAAAAARGRLAKGAVVLVKGSRGMRMEEVVGMLAGEVE